MSRTSTRRTAARGSGPRRSRPRRGLLGLLLRVCLVGLLVGAAVAGGALWWLTRDLPRFDALVDYAPLEATRVYAADGSLVATFHEELRTVVPPEEIPEVLKRAILAAEDADFYRHEGLDYVGIARAFLKNLLAGEMKQGASTITQQVVKTFLLSPERTLERKLKEAILARRLEKNLTKDEILYLYLNQIYFGHGRYGVEEASRFYFGKGVKDLGLGEAAVIAGVVQSPARLSPVNHPERAKQRQRYVLDRMLENGWIDAEAHAREVAAPIVVAARREPAPAPIISRRCDGGWWRPTATTPSSAAACRSTSGWTRPSSERPTRRCARGSSPSTAAGVGGGPWGRWTPRDAKRWPRRRRRRGRRGSSSTSAAGVWSSPGRVCSWPAWWSGWGPAGRGSGSPAGAWSSLPPG